MKTSIPPDILSKLYARSPWDENLVPVLKTWGFEEPRKAWRNLSKISDQASFPELFPTFFPTLIEALNQAYQPDTALVNFFRFSEKLHDKDYFYLLLSAPGNLLRALIVLFSGSQVLTDTLLKTPSHFDWLKEPDTLSKPSSKDTLFRDFYLMAGSESLPENTPDLLRKFKRREYIRIGLRDLMGLADLKENVEHISNLADVCLQVAYEYADKNLKARYGFPMFEMPNGEWVESEFAVIGMGKLGGRELNYSSDIDLIYIYTSSQGETRPLDSNNPETVSISNHEFFTKLAQLLTRYIHEITAEGNVFRVDMDLRPEGRSGELVNSLVSSEIYYQSWGKTWERQALIKGRVTAGSENLGKEFFAMMEPFIYRRSLDFGAIEEIKEMKKKIDRQLKEKNDDQGNIKLGFGGIREIEFIVQAHQLLFGGRHKELRVRGTLDTLDRLQEQGFFSEADFHHLREAYIFLRRLENRVQMSFGLQTCSLPKREKDLCTIARKMGFEGDSVIADFEKEFVLQTHFVGSFFKNLFEESGQRQASEEISQKWEESTIGEKDFSWELLQSLPFSDPKRAFQFLKILRDEPAGSFPSQKSIRNFYRLLPEILKGCSRTPCPNSAIENLVKFIEASGAKEKYFNLLLKNEKFLELLMVLFGSSDSLSRVLIRKPEFMDVLLEAEGIYRYKHPEKIAARLLEDLQDLDTLAEKKDFLRCFKQAEELRIGVRYLIRETDLMGTLTDLSVLADIYLETILKVAQNEIVLQYQLEENALDAFAIIGMGKLGGNELNFGSDLDIVFIYDEPESPAVEMVTYFVSLSQKLFELTSEPTSAGYAYKIDTELRPEGNQGMLAMSLQGYKRYLETRGQVWEQQAMIRARFIAGDTGLGERYLQMAHEFTYRSKLEYSSLIEIARLRERMENELAQEFKKGKDLKKGYGGLADIEFTVQILLLMHGCKTQRLRQTNTLEALKNLALSGILDQAQADQLGGNYLFLRNLECALRIQDAHSESRLPKKPEELAALAKLLGFSSKDASHDLAARLIKDYEEATGRIRAFYRKTIDTLLRTALS